MVSAVRYLVLFITVSNVHTIFHKTRVCGCFNHVAFHFWSCQLVIHLRNPKLYVMWGTITQQV